MASGQWESAPRKSCWRRSDTCGRDGGARSVLHPAPRAGFTMVELLIVMVPGAIMVTIAMPRLDLRRFRIDAAVRDANLMLLGAQRLDEGILLQARGGSR
ncbi:MAG TPA: prepilin-type N-terminal cleavage/methylation domain-containing protein [Longimicrobiales bacterium]|nr:prepilin-type N-terminal cleavage/methylation domain-containing protein [Longimicrobiales bacterium]